MPGTSLKGGVGLGQTEKREVRGQAAGWRGHGLPWRVSDVQWGWGAHTETRDLYNARQGISRTQLFTFFEPQFTHLQQRITELPAGED